MRKAISLAILVMVLTGCASAQWKGKVISLDHVEGPGFGDAVPTTGGVVGGIAAGASAATGSTISSSMRAGAGVGIAGGVVQAIMDRGKTVTVCFAQKALSGQLVETCHKQKPTPEVSRLEPGSKAVFAVDKDGDLVLVPYD